MTNAEIIFAEGQRLAEEGLIQYTGKTFKAQMEDGSVMEFRETEPIHTYAVWKELGFQVMKGQHAITKLTIWKYKPPKDDEQVSLVDRGEMFMKTAHFFSQSQVEKVGA